MASSLCLWAPVYSVTTSIPDMPVRVSSVVHRAQEEGAWALPPLPAWEGTSNLPPGKGRQKLTGMSASPWHALAPGFLPFCLPPFPSRPRHDLPPTTRLGLTLSPSPPSPHAAGLCPSPRPLLQFGSVSRGLLWRSGCPFSVKIRTWGVLLAPSCPVGGPQRWIIDLEFVGEPWLGQT